MKRLYLLLCIIYAGIELHAQSIDVGLTDYASYLYERQLILNGKSDAAFLNLQPYDRLTMARNTAEMSTDSPNPELAYILDENEMFLYKFAKANKDSSGFTRLHNGKTYFRQSKRPFLRYFYRTPAQFFQVDATINERNYRLRINPIAHFAIGPEKGKEWVFINQRGIQVDVGIAGKLYITSNIIESQAHFPSYVAHYIRKYKAIPGNGFYKRYKSSVFDGASGYDFMNSTAKIGFNIIPKIGLEFGYGKNKIGYGIRSLALSDFADNYLYLRLRTHIGRFIYQNIFGEIFAMNGRQIKGSTIVPKKYFATHYLGVKALDNLQVGIFETVVFSRSRGFELQYLNPVILYRTIEGALGSPDNMIMGIDARWDIAQRYSLYGQLVLDEFKATELIFGNNHWWANKYAFQVGLKAFDLLGIHQLDANVEMNFIRPFMYAHKDSSSTWLHGNQSLAHPRGANLREFLFNIRYRPSINWDISITGMAFSQGISPKGENYGDDPRVSYNTRSHDHGNVLLQGIRDDIFLFRTRISYMLWHGAFIDLIGQTRNSSIEGRSTYISLGFRWNASMRSFLY